MTHEHTLCLVDAIVRELEFKADSEEQEWRAKLIQAKCALILHRLTAREIEQISGEVENDNQTLTVCVRAHNLRQA